MKKCSVSVYLIRKLLAAIQIVLRCKPAVHDENQCAAAQCGDSQVAIGVGQYGAAVAVSSHTVATDEILLHLVASVQHDGAPLGVGVAVSRTQQEHG